LGRKRGENVIEKKYDRTKKREYGMIGRENTSPKVNPAKELSFIWTQISGFSTLDFTEYLISRTSNQACSTET
jgi:hypothetical protein